MSPRGPLILTPTLGDHKGSISKDVSSSHKKGSRNMIQGILLCSYLCRAPLLQKPEELSALLCTVP